MIIDKITDNEITTLEENFPEVFNHKGIKQDLVDNPFSRYLFFSLNSKIVAFINYTLIYDRIEIININVLDDYQNKKIASNLLEEVMKIGKVNNCVNITLEVNVDNFKAIALYQKFMFNEVAIRKGYYNGKDALLMERSL